MAILDFSVSGWHGFDSVTQVCFGISVSNFMCMSFVAVGRNLTIFSYVAFKWLPCDFEQCHPLLGGGGILVDHWSTISSLSLNQNGPVFFVSDVVEVCQIYKLQKQHAWQLIHYSNWNNICCPIKFASVLHHMIKLNSERKFHEFPGMSSNFIWW